MVIISVIITKPTTKKDISYFCSASCIGKSHRLHSPLSTTKYTSPLEFKFSYEDLPLSHLQMNFNIIFLLLKAVQAC